MAGQENKILDKNAVNVINSSSPIQSNPIAPRKSSSRAYGGYKPVNKSQEFQNNVNIVEILNEFFDEANSKKSQEEIINCFHSIAINKLGYSFTAIALINNNANYLTIRFIDYIGNIYSSRVMLSEINNPIVKCFNSKTRKNIKNFDTLNIPYLNVYSGAIVPLVYQGESIGALIAGSSINIQQNNDILNIFSNYLTQFIKNKELSEKINQDTNIDTLTGLKNHSDFQESLSFHIRKSEEDNSSVSVLIFDINNFSQINRDFGHAKGDEVICMLANKIRENIRNTDIAYRYGGDKIAIILPSTDNKKACKIAEDINCNISYCLVDDIGVIKANVGVVTYPTCTKDKEKLLLLAEQAMLISKNKGYQEGTPPIVSAQDINFWNKMALDSLANIIAKKYSQCGINYEEELVSKFHNESLSSKSHVMDVITSLAGAIDAKDTYTKGHSSSVSRYAEALARALNLPEEKVERIKLGAMLHDVGKIGIPESILKKPARLLDNEMEIMKQHPSIGAHKVLEPIGTLKDLIPMVKHHHEHWNGTGYPSQLKEEEIPLEARIVSVADAFHALISDRPYRKGLSIDEAIKILREGAGIQWDKNLVRKFITIAPSLCTTV